MTGRERLEFASELALRDLKRLSPGDWQNLRDELRRFFNYDDEHGSTVKDTGGIIPIAPKPERITDDEIHRIQRELMRLLKSALPGQPKYSMVQVSARFGLATIGKHSVLQVFGEPREVFLFVVVALLAMRDSLGVTVLACPVCNRPFVRKSRQKFCTPAHTWVDIKQRKRKK